MSCSRKSRGIPWMSPSVRTCALVQILETVPPERLFGADYPYFSSFTDTLLQHSAANVAARIAEQRLDGNSLVIELASNDGYLLQYYREQGIPVLGIDPAPGPVAAARARGIETLQAFFGRDLAKQLAADGRRADIIHANNVLAHVADTNGFVAGMSDAAQGRRDGGDRGPVCQGADRSRRVRHHLSRASLLLLGDGAQAASFAATGSR